jgi:hypothetical protein
MASGRDNGGLRVGPGSSVRFTPDLVPKAVLPDFDREMTEEYRAACNFIFWVLSNQARKSALYPKRIPSPRVALPDFNSITLEQFFFALMSWYVLKAATESYFQTKGRAALSSPSAKRLLAESALSAQMTPAQLREHNFKKALEEFRSELLDSGQFAEFLAKELEAA